ncbi:Putative Methionyl-tRNA synthetase [Rhizopus microsporus]|nr:Putative Methionyl-tRNA synthetase [Rhizopus microsporus]
MPLLTLLKANKYFTRAEPWNLAKKPEEKDKLDTVLWYSLETCRIAGILLQPVMPTKMNELLTGLGVSQEERYFKDAKKLAEKERPLGEMGGVLFPRIKTSMKEN